MKILCRRNIGRHPELKEGCIAEVKDKLGQPLIDSGAAELIEPTPKPEPTQEPEQEAEPKPVEKKTQSRSHGGQRSTQDKD